MFTVSRTGPTDGALAVSYTLGGSAVNGTDYVSLSGTVTIPDGQPSTTIDLNAIDDYVDDDLTSEDVVATLASSTAYITGSPNSATVTIDEEPLPTVSIAATTSATSELNTPPGVFTVTRTGPTDEPLTVDYGMSGSAENGLDYSASSLTVYYSLSGTAQNGTDYSSLSGSVQIPAGQRSANVTVTPIDDGDGDDNQQSENVVATLTSGTGYTLGSQTSATVTIDEESSQSPITVTMSMQNSTTTEGQNYYPGVFIVNASSPPANSLTVYYSLSGTAQNGTDFQTINNYVVIPAGSYNAQINIVPLDDGDGDDNLTSEYVTINLTSGSGHTIGSSSSGTVTINEETMPPEMLSLPAKQDPSAASVGVAEVRAAAAAAAVRWLESGVPATAITADLRGLRFAVQDLPGSMVGQTDLAAGRGRPPEIIIDTNAAGYGWFVDRTPLGDGEFANSIAPSERQAVSGSPAYGHVDLLTVVMHEMGHLFGLPDLAATAYPFDIMAETLDLSTRRIPLAGPPDVPAASAPVIPARSYAIIDELFAISTQDRTR